MAARAKKSRASALRPRRGQIYRVGRRRVRIVGVQGLDRSGRWKESAHPDGPPFPSATWESVSNRGDKRYGREEKRGWTQRRAWLGRTFLHYDHGAWVMPAPYELEGE